MCSFVLKGSEPQNIHSSSEVRKLEQEEAKSLITVIMIITITRCTESMFEMNVTTPNICVTVSSFFYDEQFPTNLRMQI
jgi:hypothetical protein